MSTHSFLPLKQLPKHASSCYKQIPMQVFVPKHAYMFDAILTNLDVFRVPFFLSCKSLQTQQPQPKQKRASTVKQKQMHQIPSPSLILI
jgi:hypothetical protein